MMEDAHILTLPPEMSDLTWPEKIDFMYQQQLETWKMAKTHYQHFELTKTRDIAVNGFPFVIQHNPSRARSTCANLQQNVIEKRPCFLCLKNLDTEQKGLIIHKKYLLLVNPFPIFIRHLTVSEIKHRPQRIKNRIIDMLELTALLEGYTVFYNGPLCGASAPDHFHFQSAPTSNFPINSEIENQNHKKRTVLFEKEDLRVYVIPKFPMNAIMVESEWKEPIDYFFAQLYKKLPLPEDKSEPLLNIMASNNKGLYRLIIFPRKAQRPSCFFKNDPERIMVSPASAEFGGIMVTPREEDFKKITEEDLMQIFREISLDIPPEIKL
ncbi:MAG: DUF4922 domain-containing protein [Prolixibacteraceae bacterium]|nr:DUF4922 domain-containing protein [Prolixibacteraceae bacterium]